MVKQEGILTVLNRSWKKCSASRRLTLSSRLEGWYREVALITPSAET